MTIDTNIIVAYLEGEQSVISTMSAWHEQGKSLFLSAVTETEILSFPDFSLSEMKETEQFLEANFAFIAFDRNLARIAAGIRRDRKIKLPDAAIAATALFTHTPLITRNQRDFKQIGGLRIITI